MSGFWAKTYGSFLRKTKEEGMSDSDRMALIEITEDCVERFTDGAFRINDWLALGRSVTALRRLTLRRHIVKTDDGFRLPNFAAEQTKASEVLAKRDATARRMRELRARKSDTRDAVTARQELRDQKEIRDPDLSNPNLKQNTSRQRPLDRLPEIHVLSRAREAPPVEFDDDDRRRSDDAELSIADARMDAGSILDGDPRSTIDPKSETRLGVHMELQDEKKTGRF